MRKRGRERETEGVECLCNPSPEHYLTTRRPGPLSTPCHAVIVYVLSLRLRILVCWPNNQDSKCIDPSSSHPEAAARGYSISPRTLLASRSRGMRHGRGGIEQEQVLRFSSGLILFHADG